MNRKTRLPKGKSSMRKARLQNVGTIMAVHNLGTIWSFDVKLPSGHMKTISGDWRPMRDGLDSAFDIGSPEFPYVSNKKIYENVIGQKITFVPDPTFGASSWEPSGEKAFSLKVDDKGRISRVKS